MERNSVFTILGIFKMNSLGCGFQFDKCRIDYVHRSGNFHLLALVILVQLIDQQMNL